MAAIMVVSMTAPAMTANTSSVESSDTCSVNGGCNACEDSETEECSTCGCGCANMTVEDIDGAEENKVIAEALKNDEVKDLRKELIDRGYTPKVSEANATVVEGCNNATVVKIPFKTHVDEVNASIVWQEANGVEDAKASVIGSAGSGEFSETMGILKDNETYQDWKDNESLNIKEDKITVSLNIDKDNSDSESAVAIIPIEGKETSIAKVSLEDDKVTYIEDWTCTGLCYILGMAFGGGCVALLCGYIPVLCPSAGYYCQWAYFTSAQACIYECCDLGNCW